MLQPRPTVIDTDPGLDDAVGILFTLDHAEQQAPPQSPASAAMTRT